MPRSKMAPLANSRACCGSGQGMVPLSIVAGWELRGPRHGQSWQGSLSDADEQRRGARCQNEVDDGEAAKGDELIRHRRDGLAGAHDVVNDPGLTPDLGDGPAALNGQEPEGSRHD